MSLSMKKIWLYVLLFVFSFSVFMAIERYIDNDNKVKKYNKIASGQRIYVALENNVAFSMQSRSTIIKPAMPALVKYALFFALISGLAAYFLFDDISDNTKTPLQEEISRLKNQADL